MWLRTLEFGVEVALPVGRWRARFSAAGMDAGRAADSRLVGEPVLDRYLLQLWPAPDVVLRQTSSIAACGHELARQTEPPPPAPTPEQVAAALAAAEAALVQEQRP